MTTADDVALAAARAVRAMHASAANFQGGNVICVICGRPFRGGHNSQCAWARLVSVLKEYTPAMLPLSAGLYGPSHASAVPRADMPLLLDRGGVLVLLPLPPDTPVLMRLDLPPTTPVTWIGVG